MTSPLLELQDLVVRTLKATSGVSALVDDRIYDRVPADAELPYIAWGPEQAVADDTDCTDGFDITIQIDVYSNRVGRGEAKKIAEAIRLAFSDEDTLMLTDNALVLFHHNQTRILPEPDGLTSHAAVEFAVFIEQP